MKTGFIFLAISIFLTLLGSFVLSNFSPFDLDKVQEIVDQNEVSKNNSDALDAKIQTIIQQGLIFDYLSTNAYLALFIFAGSIFAFVAFLHSVIDKIFFKSIWQAPSLFNAIRRALLFSASVLLMIYLRFLNVDTATILLVPVTGIVAEFAFLTLKNDYKVIFRRFSTKSVNKEDQEKELETNNHNLDE